MCIKLTHFLLAISFSHMEKIRDHTEAKPTDTPMLLHYLPTKRLNLLSPSPPKKTSQLNRNFGT